MSTRVLLWAVVLAALPRVASAAQAAAEPARSIVNVRGDVYQFQNGDQVSVFVVAPDGIVVVDPLDPATATWLKAELATRFSGRPVRFVVQTTHSVARAGGASVFGRDVTVVAQARFNRVRADAARATPPRPTSDPRQDLNTDGTVTGDELYTYVAAANRSFDRRDTLSVGGKNVELWSAPVGDAVEHIVILFAAERVAFAADLFDARTLPERVGPAGADALVRSFRPIEQLDFDVMLTGDGRTVTKADLVAHREYVEALASGVKRGFAAGQSLAEVQDSLTLDSYQQWGGYAARRRVNIADAYGALHRTGLSVLFGGTYGFAGVGDDCNNGLGCSLSGAARPGGVAGLRYSLGKLGGGARVFVQQASTAHFAGGFTGSGNDVQRDTILAFSVSYAAGRPDSRVSAIIHAGPTVILSRHATTRFGFFGYSAESSSSAVGLGAGADVQSRLGKRLSLVIPLQLLRGATNGSIFGSTRFTAGAGIALTLAQGVR